MSLNMSETGLVRTTKNFKPFRRRHSTPLFLAQNVKRNPRQVLAEREANSGYEIEICPRRRETFYEMDPRWVLFAMNGGFGFSEIARSVCDMQ